MKILTILLISMLLGRELSAAETCSRVATINYQEVLVDVSGAKRGEGLRYYLEKDAAAKELLDEYQDNSKSTWRGAAMSTLGTGMMIGSFLATGGEGSNGVTNRNFLLFGGLSLIGLSYLISKTNQFNNEYLLSRSVEEYNKRNSPRIYFSPTDSKSMGLGVGMSQEF